MMMDLRRSYLKTRGARHLIFTLPPGSLTDYCCTSLDVSRAGLSRFWDRTSYSLVSSYKRFGLIFCKPKRHQCSYLRQKEISNLAQIFNFLARNFLELDYINLFHGTT